MKRIVEIFVFTSRGQLYTFPLDSCLRKRVKDLIAPERTAFGEFLAKKNNSHNEPRILKHIL